MKIAVLGAGDVGAALGMKLAKAGHQVVFGSRNPGSAEVQQVVKQCGDNAAAATSAEAVGDAEAVIAALPWKAAGDVLAGLDLTGKVVIDCTNPFAELTDGQEKVISGAEMLQSRVPGMKLAKCWNTTGWGNMVQPEYSTGKSVMFVCADDDEARRVAIQLSDDTGFETYYAGPLANSHWLENLAQLWVWLAYHGGLGRDFAFQLVRR